jgi:DNA primase
MNTTEYSREEIIAVNPLLDYAQKQGWQLKRRGSNFVCLCPLYEETTPSFTIDPRKNLWTCFGCDTGGSIIDLHAQLRGLSIGEAMRELSGGFRDGFAGSSATKALQRKENIATPKPALEPTQSETEIADYDYQDATGKVVFQVVRYKPKAFKQCRIVDGKRVWSMEGVERLPYRLPELLANPTSVWIVEGERDVETLRTIGQTATCNPGGAGKWLPAFSQYLRGKCVYIAADNDDPGQKHGREVLKSLEGIVKWVKWIELPREHNGKPIKDITDLRDLYRGEDFQDLLVNRQRRRHRGLHDGRA